MQSIYAASAHIFVKRKKNSLGKSFDFGVDPLAVFKFHCNYARVSMMGNIFVNISYMREKANTHFKIAYTCKRQKKCSLRRYKSQNLMSGETCTA